jgi:putative Ca2+/H+ antiporter (TMEM165/GDT1 family)
VGVSVGDAVQAFAAVFPAELPDKTMVASVVLVARFRRPAAVWVGAAAAFTVHVTVAVTLGSFVGRLPATPVQLVVAALFAVGAGVLLRESADDDELPVGGIDAEPGSGVTTGARTATVAAFGTVLLAEWGDLTQIATASLAARSDAPVAVGVGALAALWTVAAVAAVAGQALARRIPTRLLQRVAAAVFAGLAIWTLVELAR